MALAFPGNAYDGIRLYDYFLMLKFTILMNIADTEATSWEAAHVSIRIQLCHPTAAAWRRLRNHDAPRRTIDRAGAPSFGAHERAPRQIILDLDATDDPVHGEQEGRFFHGVDDCTFADSEPRCAFFYEKCGLALRRCRQDLR